VGINTAASDLNINSNAILNSTIGIGFSIYTGAGQILISGNMIQGAFGRINRSDNIQWIDI
jgi:hypothetical protein